MPAEKPTYFLSRWLFLRGLALVFAIAFLSYGSQIDGLIGSRGVLPIAEFVERVRSVSPDTGFLELPTFCWWSASDATLRLQCGAGVLLSIALFVGLAPRACLVLLWALYLSLATAGQVFLSFQWDVLLLETAIFAIPFAPATWLPGLSREKPPSPAALFLVRWLLFRLMFASALTKITYGDESWHDGTAIAYHYWTQPLPTVFGWWANQLPAWFHRASCVVMYGIELGLPFLAFFGRGPRIVAFAGLVLLQALIALTGNYGFFNLLSVVLCVSLLDDAVLVRLLPKRLIDRFGRSGRLGQVGDLDHPRPARRLSIAGRIASWILAGLVVLQTTFTLLANVRAIDELPAPVAAIDRAIGSFRSLNDYGLFRVMTKERREIEIQGSDDGIAWKPYLFRWKPGDLESAPIWVQPHMPRLDWEMWFAALGSMRSNPWLGELQDRLLEGSPSVLGLLGENPFPKRPPRFVRAILFEYRFTTRSERAAGAGYWTRGLVGTYAGARTLR